MSASLPLVIQRAIDASAAGDTQAAMRLLQEAITDLPGVALPHFLLGAEFAQAGQIEDAEAAYSRAVLLAPAFEIARFQLGLLQFTSGRSAVALLTWQPLSLLPDAHPLQRFVLAFAELAQDRFAEALACFREGIAANHENPPLNVDMQKIIDKILELHEVAEQPDAAADAKEAERDAHVLLSNYRQNGPFH